MGIGEVLGLMNQTVPWDTLGLTAGIAIVLLLSARELAQAYAGPRVSPRGWPLDKVVLALLVLFVLAVAERVAYRFFLG